MGNIIPKSVKCIHSAPKTRAPYKDLHQLVPVNGRSGGAQVKGLLGGSWDLVSKVISRL